MSCFLDLDSGGCASQIVALVGPNSNIARGVKVNIFDRWHVGHSVLDTVLGGVLGWVTQSMQPIVSGSDRPQSLF